MSITKSAFDGQILVDSYVEWLRESITTRAISGTDYIEFTTPFLDRNNDHLQIYVRKDGDKFVATDGGRIINELEMTGVSIDTPKRKELVQLVLNGFGVVRVKDSLEISFAEKNFPQAKNNLIQAMLGVDDLFYMSTSNVQFAFIDDVKMYFEAKEIYAIEDVGFIGKSGFLQKFDFMITKSKNKPERYIKVVNQLSRQQVANIWFTWEDTQKTRSDNVRFITIYNDRLQAPDASIGALKEYGVDVFPWSQRDNNIEMLTA